MNIEEFIQEVKKLNIEVDNDKLKKLEIYCDFLLEYNVHTNLTAIKTKKDVYLKHFYDSLTIVKVADLSKEKTLLDIGSGAGFPGMVLKIFFPELHVFLVDANNKKTKFLEELKIKLNVDKLEVINNRIENITQKFLNSIDIVTARAVTNLPVLLELATPLVSVNKYFIAMKGNANEELQNSIYVIKFLNCELLEALEFNLPFNAGNRTLIRVKKCEKSDINKLRSYDKIIKKPLQNKFK